MHLKSFVAAAALATAALASHAEDINVNPNLVPDGSVAGAFSAGWGVTHSLAGVFTDTFAFSGAGLVSPSMVDGSLINVAFRDSQDIDFTSVSINGQNFALSSLANLDLATLSPSALVGPLVMQVAGIAAPLLADGTAISASYAGTLNVAAVPEPGTTALLLAGLGTVGLLARRRAKG